MQYKKNYFSLLLFILFLTTNIFLLNSCKKENSTDEIAKIDQTNQQEKQIIEGFLKKLGSIGYKNAKHFIEQDDSSVIYVISDTDLNADKYESVRIQAEGYFMKTDDLTDKEIFQIEKITILEENEKDTNQNIDFRSQIYQYFNPNLGLKFNFSGNWALKTEDPKISLRYENFTKADDDSSKSTALPSIEISLETKTFSTELNTQNDSNPFSALYKWVEIRHPSTALNEIKIGPDQMETIKATFSDNKIFYYVQRIDSVYLISYQAPAIENFSEAKTSFNQILDSFQFIAITEGADSTVKLINGEKIADEQEDSQENQEFTEENNAETKILNEDYAYFKSESNHFQIQYPKSWYYTGLEYGIYVFSDKSIENNNQLLTLRITSKSNKTPVDEPYISIMKKIDDSKYYILEGDKQYEEIMNIMLDSIEEIQ